MRKILSMLIIVAFLLLLGPKIYMNSFLMDEVMQEEWAPELNYTIPEHEALMVAQRLGLKEISTDIPLTFDLLVPADHASFLKRNFKTITIQIDGYKLHTMGYDLYYKKLIYFNVEGSKYFVMQFSGYLEYGQPIAYDFHEVTFFNETTEVLKIPFYEEVEPDFEAIVAKFHSVQ